jgi:GH24 family phage-related lysozyme (muramidase)
MLCAEEGLILNVYPDPVGGNPTIGYGHKLTGAEIGSGIYRHGITPAEAQELLDRDIAIVDFELRQHVRVELNDNQRDALTCLAFNAGTGVLSGKAPKLMAAVNREDWVGAAREFLDICHVRRQDGSIVCADFLRQRRIAEAALFLSPVEDIGTEEILAQVSISLDSIRSDLWRGWRGNGDGNAGT